MRHNLVPLADVAEFESERETKRRTEFLANLFRPAPPILPREDPDSTNSSGRISPFRDQSGEKATISAGVRDGASRRDAATAWRRGKRRNAGTIHSTFRSRRRRSRRSAKRRRDASSARPPPLPPASLLVLLATHMTPCADIRAIREVT